MPENKKAKLQRELFNDKKMELVPTRDGYGKGLLTLGKTNPRVVALCADLDESTRSQWFAEKYPERFIQMGIGEQNMVLVAAGLANYGKIPFIASYATFSPGRNNEQIRTTVSLSELPVKIAGAHAGVSVGPDGATHQALEDIALMRVQPNMVVICPCDAVEIEKATVAAAAVHGPVYLRFGRAASPVMTTRKTPFKIGCAEIFWTGKDITIIACGQLVYQALLAARALAKDNITAEVINCHTIKPLDEKTIIASVKKTRAVVTVEEHQIAGGLGSAVAETLVQRLPVPMEFVGVRDRFGESGEPDELLQKFGLTSPYIVTAVRKVLKRKK